MDGRPPRRPSRIDRGAGPVSLAEAIDAAPEAELGADAVRAFGPRLPFLLKLLAAGSPLSLQVHPDLAQAKEGFADEERRGVPIDAGHRNYKDANHKPELIVALTPSTACAASGTPRRPRTSWRAWASTTSSRTSTSCAPARKRTRCARCSPPY